MKIVRPRIPRVPPTHHQPRQDVRMQTMRSVADSISMPEEALRELDHVEWLNNFSKMLDLHTQVERTPLRVGTINRLRLAAGFIGVLQRDINRMHEKLQEQEREIKLLRAETDRRFGQPHHGHDDPAA